LELIQPNPWQTREGKPDPAYIKELALDIAQNGLLQTPVARNTGTAIQLAFGHNRLAAYKWLNDVKDHSNILGDYSEMPLDIRVLTDEQMALLAWSENEKRRDVTPIERARAIARRIEAFGWSQKEAAEALGISRPVVSNALRLLELPEEVQAGLAEGKVSERQAVALAGLFDLPEELRKRAESHYNYAPSKIVKATLKGELSSDAIRDDIDGICNSYASKLANVPWGLDEVLQYEGAVSPACRECEKRVASRNLCLEHKCFTARERAHKVKQLEKASQASGIPALDGGQYGWADYTSFEWGGKSRHFEVIQAAGCPNLRLRYDAPRNGDQPGKQRVEGYPEAQIVCAKKEQFCTCLAGAEQRAKVEELGAATVEELKEAAKEARREKRQAKKDQELLAQETAERIATGLVMKNRDTWWRLICELSYNSGAKREENDIWNLQVGVGLAIVDKHLPYDPLDMVERMNELLKKCGLEPLGEMTAARLQEIASRELAEREIL
jgi:ParB family chromosome partitioning protein